MAAAKLDILIDQGSTFEMPCQLQDPTGAPINITGATIAAKIRKNASDPNVVATFTTPITDAPNGAFKLALAAAITAAIVCDPSSNGVRKITTYSYDVNITYADLTVQRLLEGVAQISPEVTR